MSRSKWDGSVAQVVKPGRSEFKPQSHSLAKRKSSLGGVYIFTHYSCAGWGFADSYDALKATFQHPGANNSACS
jgi:hypothetical protein